MKYLGATFVALFLCALVALRTEPDYYPCQEAASWRRQIHGCEQWAGCVPPGSWYTNEKVAQDACDRWRIQ